MEPSEARPGDVAIVGMAGRFPGADDIATFWDNLRRGVESIAFFTDDEVDPDVPAAVRRDPLFVRAGGLVADIDCFDARFFNVSAREAELLDPQQRLFLQCAYAAFEDAGYDPEVYPGLVAVYAGAGINTYALRRAADLAHDPLRMFQFAVASDKDFVATRVAHKLDLRGEAVTVQTACSTSLVATHLACQSLLTGQSDLALAGGTSLGMQGRTGYLYNAGGIASPDGHCRTFDRRAQGTVPSGGVGVVVLKLLETALRDGDHVHAVIRGSAINNDGRNKAGFTAPALDGQADVIAKALEIAEVHPDTVGYVEAHGTATPLGDPIEFAALVRAFRARTSRRAFCALGSLKSNVGHMDAAAGVGGLIKAALALRHGEIPASLHFETANPALALETSPFFVPTQTRSWARGDTPRRAGVSSFGIGGTNAHVVLEEAPATAPGTPGRAVELVTFSGATAEACDRVGAQLANALESLPDASFADAAFTRNAGRHAHAHRGYVVASDRTQAIASLRSARSRTPAVDGAPRIALLFPGQGGPLAGVARGLYQSERTFRADLDQCAAHVFAETQTDLREVVVHGTEAAEAGLAVALPALLSVGYATARWLAHLGLRAHAMLGHSFGEYTAACLAGVFPLERALTLAVARGRLMQSMPPGAMIAVGLSESGARACCTDGVTLASVNGATRCVLSGPIGSIAALSTRLAAQRVPCARLAVTRAYHSADVDALSEALTDAARRAAPVSPTAQYVSCATGVLATDEVADPAYWARQMRAPVRFAAGLDALRAQGCTLFLEAGPGGALAGLARQHFGRKDVAKVASAGGDLASALDAIGQAYRAGAVVDWTAYHADQRRRRIPLPTYPFERVRHWIPTHPRDSVASPSARSSPVPVASVSLRETPRTPPRNAVESVVARAWRATLGVTEIDVDDSWIELGGDSLLAAQVLDAFRALFPGLALTLQDVLGNGTIAQQARVVQQRLGGDGLAGEGTATDGWPDAVVRLRVGNGTPFVLAPPMAGNVFEYVPLVRHLAPGRPVWGLQPPSVVKGRVPYERIEDLAAYFLDGLRRVQPEGPYRLGGHSMGGLVALEMARSLRAMGSDVASLVFLDTPAVATDPYEMILETLRDDPRGREVRVMEPAVYRALSLEDKVRHVADIAAAVGEMPVEGGRPLIEASLRAMLRYAPAPYHGRITQLRATEHTRGDASWGWDAIASGGVEVIRVPGDHYTMTAEPHVRVLAARLDELLVRPDDAP